MIDSHIHLGKFLDWYFFRLSTTMKNIEKVFADYDGVLIIPAEDANNKNVMNAVAKTKLNAKFAVWATPDNYQEISRMAFDAVKIHPAFTKIPISHQKYDKIIELAEERDVPILCHAGDIPVTDYHHIIDRAIDFKQVIFIVGHLGGKSYQKQWRCPIDIEPHKNIYIDTCMRRIYWTIEHCVNVIGSSRMMFGSDYPIMHPNVGIAAIKNTNISQVEYENIINNTAKDILW